MKNLYTDTKILSTFSMYVNSVITNRGRLSVLCLAERNENSIYFMGKKEIWKARWPIGRASDSGARGRGFDPHSGRRVVSLSKIHLPPKKVLIKRNDVWPFQKYISLQLKLFTCVYH